nr:MAG TPA: hypothetical protein [Caudoviricetes sp.]
MFGERGYYTVKHFKSARKKSSWIYTYRSKHKAGQSC